MTTKVIELHAENYKRLRAVTIRPGGENIVMITGRNAQGKSATLDALFAAFAGGEASRATQRPIRDGEETALIRVDLGDYIVTRRFTKDDAGTLTVEAHDGARFSSPQKMLDDLLGRRTFDPHAFISLPAKEQVRVLIDVLGDSLGFDPEKLAAERKGIFDRRTEVGRDVKKLEGQLAGYPVPPAGLPAEELSAADLLAEARAAQEHNTALERARDAAKDADAIRSRAEDALQEAQRALSIATADAADARAAYEQMPPAIDTTAIAEKLSNLEQINTRVRAAAHRAAVAAELSDRRAEVGRFTIALRDLDAKRDAALAAASETLPVSGLSLDDNGVTYNGIPFSQASHSEQLRVSTALSMAFHPELRVLRIDNGEALDAESLAIIDELAGENDYQVFVSAVAEGPGTGIYIEDGAVA